MSRPEREGAALDTPSMEYLETQDLGPDKFPLHIVAGLEWWPNEIFIFLKVLGSADYDFTGYYMRSPGLFDSGIRRVQSFMLMKKYGKIKEITDFVDRGELLDSDDYFIKMIGESTFGTGPARSDGDNHEFFARALEKLVELSPGYMADGDQRLDAKDEKLARVYSGVYILKTLYAKTDVILRGLIGAALERRTVETSVYSVCKGLLEEIERRLLAPLRDHKDESLYNRICIFRDLILFAFHSSAQFSFVVNFHRRFEDAPEAEVERLIAPETATLDRDSIDRIQRVYRYYFLRAKVGDIKIRAATGSGNIAAKILEADKIMSSLTSPRYSIDTETLPTRRMALSLAKGRRRQISCDVQVQTPRQDTFSISETGAESGRT